MKRILSVFLVVVLLFSALPITVSAAIQEPDLQDYLTELNWSKEELVEELEFYDYTLEDFESIEELRDFFGPVLTEENLAQLLEEFELTLDELIALLDEYGETLDDYYFYNDLEFAIFFYLNGDDEFFKDIAFGIFEEIGLTNEEFEALIAHLEKLDFENEEFEAKLLVLLERLEAFEEFEDLDSPLELEAEQLAELAAIFKELLAMFELEANFFFVKGNEKISVSLIDLMKLTSTNGYDLLIEFYNLEGEFLADILLTAELFGIDLITDTGSDLKEVVEKEKVKKEQKPVKTEKGAKLPKTASNYLQNSLLGLLTAFAGIFVFRKIRIRGNV